MVRSTAISWKTGAAVVALALPLWPLPALADDQPAEKAEPRHQPIEPTKVRVILVPPPAGDTVFATQRPDQMEAAPVILVQPAPNPIVAQPRPESAEPASIMVQPAGNTAISQPRPEPAKTLEDAALVEKSLPPERRPRAALLPPVSNPAVASPRPEAALPRPEAPKAEKSALAVIPALPGRSPFRQTPFKTEFAENGPETAIPFLPAPEPAPAKSNSPFRFLTSLWSGNKPASTPVSTPASPPAQGQDGDKPKPASFLDKIQFWKN